MNSEKNDELKKILEKAAKKPSFRPEFYRILLQSNLFILENNDTIKTHCVNSLSIRENSLVRWKNEGGDFFVPIFSSMQEADRAAKDGQHGVCVTAKLLFESNINMNYILNPLSDFSKELSLEEIKLLLGNSECDSLVEIEKNKNILIDRPSSYPSDLLKNLSIYLSKSKAVTSAYLVQIYIFSTLEEKRHFLIALDGIGDLSKIFPDLSIIIQAYIQFDEYVDLIQLGKHSVLDEKIKKAVPFFSSE